MSLDHLLDDRIQSEPDTAVGPNLREALLLTLLGALFFGMGLLGVLNVWSSDALDVGLLRLGLYVAAIAVGSIILWEGVSEALLCAVTDSESRLNADAPLPEILSPAELDRRAFDEQAREDVMSWWHDHPQSKLWEPTQVMPVPVGESTDFGPLDDTEIVEMDLADSYTWEGTRTGRVESSMKCKIKIDDSSAQPAQAMRCMTCGEWRDEPCQTAYNVPPMNLKVNFGGKLDPVLMNERKPPVITSASMG